MITLTQAGLFVIICAVWIGGLIIGHMIYARINKKYNHIFILRCAWCGKIKNARLVYQESDGYTVSDGMCESCAEQVKREASEFNKKQEPLRDCRGNLLRFPETNKYIKLSRRLKVEQILNKNYDIIKED